MSDNIPFEIQMEIIKKVYDVKSLIQFRSVSKPWKSFIDSSEFINGFGARHTLPHSRILRYNSGSKINYICLVDDDIQSFKVQKLAPSAVSPLLKQMISYVVGSCHGLVCLFGYHNGYKKGMVVIWNPSIRKSFGVEVTYNYSLTHPYYHEHQTLDNSQYELVFGFGVCPLTSDPTVVKIIQTGKRPWYVEVFTLSSGIWNVIPSSNLPRQSIQLIRSAQVVIDKFIYWGATELSYVNNIFTVNHMVVSYNLITKEFKVVDLPDSLTNESGLGVCSVFKLRGSLVVSRCIMVDGALCCGVWVMEHDSSFRKLFTIPKLCKILGFSKSGETILEIYKEGERFTTLGVYDPCSQQMKNLRTSIVEESFFMGSNKESLLLLDHPDLHIYSGDS